MESIFTPNANVCITSFENAELTMDIMLDILDSFKPNDESLAIMRQEQQPVIIMSDCSSTMNTTPVIATQERALCPVCNAHFARKYDVARHIQTHHDASLIHSYDCDDCFKTFKRKDGLLAHRQRVHGKNSLNCGLCPKTFASESKRLMHIKRVHNVPGKL